MSLQTWLAFAAASIILLVIPGPTILTVVAYSVSHRARARLPLVAAVALGDSTALVLSLVGLGAVLAASALAFNAIKIAGGLYLIYLGVKMLRSGVAAPSEEPVREVSRGRLFLNTYAVTALNPKGIIFFVAFLPQFLNANANVAAQLWILGSTFVVLATINATLYALFAASARRALSGARAQRLFNGFGGSVLTVAGIWALFAKRITAAA
jgi:threonine/homoserine/homoserine lactone efflux protein